MVFALENKQMLHVGESTVRASPIAATLLLHIAEKADHPSQQTDQRAATFLLNTTLGFFSRSRTKFLNHYMQTSCFRF